MIGNEVTPILHMLELSHPVQAGIVKNWDEMELILRYGFDLVK